MPKDIYHKLQYVTALRKPRKELSEEILATPSLFPDLLKACFAEDNKTSTKACWVLEFVCKEKLEWILPYTDTFIDNIPKLKADGAIRSTGKVYELLCEYYFSKQQNPVRKSLTEEQLGKIAETCFDWLIGNEKVAVKAYAMRCLFLLGKKFQWIYPELQLVLQQGYTQHSAAYRSRAKHILDKIREIEVDGNRLIE
ncbi:adenylosuccinate lyase [Sinomicrobium weinanense]|uniref:Adenylosuccinate lyase n=1 Tax=Sinomicrobium weinanense TaxID=2842200 RepID=A0A926JTN4_9FLAO|nr:adenylosuccinate lyase [Sinomicrobium weinanense]MBC9797308.1 adenylosuccinate lyase [Sinomicrobium weinanense]MBU3122777.1 adenylosuccinate lyase [Sinomicrobium weinanense]